MTRYPLTRRALWLTPLCAVFLAGFHFGKFVETSKYRSVSMMFKPATKEQSRARVALIGPPGAGKTMTGLILARTLADGGKAAVIDTERGSASKYADIFAFDVCEMKTFGPLDYVKAIKEAAAAGYSALLVDSLSHAWSGIDGALELVDKAMARNKGNKFAAWKDVTPQHNALIDAMLQCDCHLIATMRSKVEWVIEVDERGRNVPRKVGTSPVQRDGMEYEFDLTADLDIDHRMIVSKTRCPELDQAVIVKPGEEVGKTLLAWLRSGAVPTPAAPVPMPATAAPVPPMPPVPAKAPPKPMANVRQKPSPAHVTACKSEKQLVALITEWYARDDFQIIGNEAKWAKVLDVAEDHLSKSFGGATPLATECLDMIREALELSNAMAATLPEGEPS